MTLCGVSARGQEPPDPRSSDGESEIRGQVFERGSLVPLVGAHIAADSGHTANTDDNGRFTLRVSAGTVPLIITLDGYQPLRVTEHLVAGQGVSVEYRLDVLPAYRKRYVSTVRGEARHEGERFTLREEELHQLAGTQGDPFRVIGFLPGVAQPITLLPIYVIRGSSPGTNGFFLDGMRVPQLFDFYPGVYDVSFGHYAGGVIDSETRPARTDARAHGEVELRLYDVSTYGEGKLPGGVQLELAGHYGNPSYLIHAFDSRADVSYWDFQLRGDWKTLTLEALGSYDYLSVETDPGRPATTMKPAVPPTITSNRLEFYRVQLRDRHKIGRVDTEAALVAGYDAFQAFGPTVTKVSLDWRASVRAHWSRFRLSAGIDGEVSRFSASNFDPGSGPDQPDALGELAGTRSGVEAGAYIDGTLEIIKRRLWATAGARIDVYNASGVTLLGIDPRFQFRAKLLPQLSITGGIGLYQQPPSFPIALPGIDTFALQLGLQRAIQAAYGVEAKLPEHLEFSITGFWQQFYNINDAVLDFSIALCTSPPPESLTGYVARVTRQINGQAYGMELMARKTAGRFTGWIAYTLSRTERQFSCGLRPADYDQTHVLNVVAQVRLPWHLMAGARFLYQSGRPVTILQPPDYLGTVRNNTRLPDYLQLDVRVDREWIFNKWALSVFLEAANLTYSQSIIGITYPTDPDTGITRYDQPQLNGFHWVLPTIGVRGRF
jgi:hypothetical protein